MRHTVLSLSLYSNLEFCVIHFAPLTKGSVADRYLEGVKEKIHNFLRATQQQVSTKIYSLTQCSLTVNKCDWQILGGNDERIKSHYWTRNLYNHDNS